MSPRPPRCGRGPSASGGTLGDAPAQCIGNYPPWAAPRRPRWAHRLPARGGCRRHADHHQRQHQQPDPDDGGEGGRLGAGRCRQGARCRRDTWKRGGGVIPDALTRCVPYSPATRTGPRPQRGGRGDISQQANKNNEPRKTSAHEMSAIPSQAPQVGAFSFLSPTIHTGSHSAGSRGGEPQTVL